MKNLVLTAAALLGFAAASMGQTLPAYLPSDGLVGWWPFNGNANDESGNGLNLFNTGANLHPDRFGNNDQSYWVGNGGTLTYTGPSITGGEAFTYSFWMKTNQNLNEFQDWIFSESGANQNGIETGIWFFFNPASKNLGIVHPAVSYAGILSYPFPGIDEWHHVVVTGPASYNVYIDGQLVSTGGSQYVPISSQITFRIGAFNGAIDDFAAYNRRMSYEEIQSVYEGSSTSTSNPSACNPLPTNFQNGLVGYWPFCGNANDESGNGHDGSAVGVSLTEDRFGNPSQAYNWDYNLGTNQYISIGSMQSNFSSGSFSLSTWIYADSGQGANPRIINFGNVHPGAWSLGKSNIDREYTIFWPPSGGIVHTKPVSSLAWHHLVFTAEFPSGMTRVYVDGTLDSSFCCTTYDPSSPIFGSWEFGRKAPTEVWGGKLDDIGIWNRALSADEVQQLYTLNACTFTVYDTVTVENIVTVYDTVTTYTTVTDTLIINTLITALAPPANTNTIKVFPNPAGSFITIDYGNFALMNGYQLRIENSLGQQVFQTNIAQQSDSLNLSNWGGNGLYFVHIVDPQGNTIDIRKIVLQ